jgi:hypothetical protein
MQSGLSERTSPQSRAWVGILLSVIRVSMGEVRFSRKGSPYALDGEYSGLGPEGGFCSRSIEGSRSLGKSSDGV